MIVFVIQSKKLWSFLNCVHGQYDGCAWNFHIIALNGFMVSNNVSELKILYILCIGTAIFIKFWKHTILLEKDHLQISKSSKFLL